LNCSVSNQISASQIESPKWFKSRFLPIAAAGGTVVFKHVYMRLLTVTTNLSLVNHYIIFIVIFNAYLTMWARCC